LPGSQPISSLSEPHANRSSPLHSDPDPSNKDVPSCLMGCGEDEGKPAGKGVTLIRAPEHMARGHVCALPNRTPGLLELFQQLAVCLLLKPVCADLVAAPVFSGLLLRSQVVSGQFHRLFAEREATWRFPVP
jgi:hypothetical protein